VTARTPVEAAQELADLLNDLGRLGFVIAAEGFDVMVIGQPLIGVVFVADGVWHVAENG
jgi:hypothetical protein